MKAADARTGRRRRADTVEVLWCDLSARTAEAAALVDEIDPAERARAARFRRPRDRDLFVLRRAWRRRRLGDVLGVAPARVRFDDTAGRPHILGSTLQLSTASSYGVAVLAFCWGAPLGVDVEKHDPSLMLEESSCFPQSTLSALCGQPDALRVPAYFDRWTEVEARTKLQGDGLPGFHADAPACHDEHLTHLPVRPGFSAALCTPGLAAVHLRKAGL